MDSWVIVNGKRFNFCLGEFLVVECGIFFYDFIVYNFSSIFCLILVVGQYVCCFVGMMFDFCLQLNFDGICVVYYVVLGESCLVFGVVNSFMNVEIESFNINIWGWQGCGNVQVYQFICLSMGVLFMFVLIVNVVCGL